MNNRFELVRLLGAISMTFITAACGGGADAESSAAPTTPLTGAGFSGTAYLKTSNTVLYAGRPSGFSRDASQALVDQCNSFRIGYRLPPVSPSDATMAGLDVTVHEKYISSDKALTLVTGTAIVLNDMQRWRSERFGVRWRTSRRSARLRSNQHCRDTQRHAVA